MWSHFAGFLILILMVLLLAFRSGPTHNNTITLSAQNNNPTLVDKLPSFDYMDTILKEKNARRRDESLKAHEAYTRNIDSQLWSTINNVDNFINKNTQSLTPQEIKSFLNNIQFQVKEIGHTFKDFEDKLGASFTDFVSVKSINKVTISKLP